MKKKTTSLTFREFTEQVSKQLKGNDQQRTGQAYMTAMRRFIGFWGKEATFDDFTPKTIIDYQKALLGEGRAMNTVSFYMRNTRVIYNRACDSGIVKKRKIKTDLFDNVFTGNATTAKRALTIEEISDVANIEIKLLPKKGAKDKKTKGVKEQKTEKTNVEQKTRELEENLQTALQYMRFAFHGRGISFIDLCHLRKSSVRNGRIHYHRKKTGRELTLFIGHDMQDIMDSFADQVKDSPYVFPILDPKKGNLRRQYETALDRQNRFLKQLGEMAGLKQPLTTHVIRHSWATIALQQGNPIAKICQALGHADEKTTAIYLASFGDDMMEAMSREVSNVIKKKE